MKALPVFEKEFHHDGRGPELRQVVWKHRGIILHGFEYFNPEDEYTDANLKHMTIDGLEAFSMAGEEVHGAIKANGKTNAAIFEIPDSQWMKTFEQRHLSECKHYQIMFYDEIYDVVCKNLSFGHGKLD